MINITFPDGSVKPFENGVTAYEIAQSISPRLAAEVLAASVNGEIYDLGRPITTDAEIKLHKWEDDEAKHVFWHSSSHLMAEALESLYPGVKFGIGPAIENGFYYDVDLAGATITDADLPKIEKKMLELAQGKEDFKRILSEPKNSLIMQYTSLLETEDVKLNITEDALDRMSVVAEEVNNSAENIGARRLHTIMEKVLADINFDADEHKGETITIDAAYVNSKLEGISENQDLSRYIL